MRFYERVVRGNYPLYIVSVGAAFNVASVWMPVDYAPVISDLGSALTWTAIPLMVYSLYHVVGPGVRLSTWWRMHRMGWKWKAVSFRSPCGTREIRRLDPGVWAAVEWVRDPDAKSFGFYRGPEHADPLTAFTAAYLDNWGE